MSHASTLTLYGPGSARENFGMKPSADGSMNASNEGFKPPDGEAVKG